MAGKQNTTPPRWNLESGPPPQAHIGSLIGPVYK